MNGQAFLNALEDVIKEKGIDKEVVFEAMELALQSAYKKHYNQQAEVRVQLDKLTGEIRVFRQTLVVDEVELEDSQITLEEARSLNPNYELGDVIEEEADTSEFGRVAAQTAKQVVIQKIREAERESIFGEFTDLEGDVVNGIIGREDARNYYVDLGRAHAILPKTEVIPGEKVRIDQNVKVYVSKVERTSKLPLILVTRKAPGILRKLLLDDADFIIQGEGDLAFYELCRNIFDNNSPEDKIIRMSMPSLDKVKLPYKYYTDDDIKNRYIYVEASRGCPFECEFCLSSMSEKVRAFDLDEVLEEFEILWQRGTRNFKFIDRTFNVNMRIANRILDFFLAKEPPYFAHFEVIPDHFPSSLKEKIKLFPDGAMQLEIGIQTLNPEIADNISRSLKLDKIKKNIAFLENETNAHIHLDLIVGLPGESLESFGRNLDELVSLSSCEIQIGILKKLSGTFINRHDIEHGMVYSNIPPYDILKNAQLSFNDIQIMKRFSRFWDLTYNSGNFKKSVRLIWGEGSVYENFYDFGIWIYEQTNSTWKISLQRLGELLFTYLTSVKNLDSSEVAQSMLEDMMKLKGRAIPAYLKPYADGFRVDAKSGTSGFNKRQL